jgi:lipopolysaccharide transport system ATP-binding protein
MLSRISTLTAPLIQLESISKCYRIYQNPQDRFKQALLDRFCRARGVNNNGNLYREHWALRDVSFSLESGEAVGILGRNGAGKSTLLQIIAGTLEPTYGSLQIEGRVTALLELGSGFNPEFTGRENVFLNAMILGMSREDTLARFDDIASFADIGDFIDQPVKTYSSGMMMRLAFAVQTAVDPTILIIDEALSVGDMFFQAKCMARIKKLVSEGVSLLFVSHDVGVVRELCNRAVLLSNGKSVSIGSTRAVTDEYVKFQMEDRNSAANLKQFDMSNEGTAIESQIDDESIVLNRDDQGLLQKVVAQEKVDVQDVMLGSDEFFDRAKNERTGNNEAIIKNVQMLRDGNHSFNFDFDDEVEIRILVFFKTELTNVNLVIKFRTLQGTDLVFYDTRIQQKIGETYRPNTTYLFRWRIRLPIMHGNYMLYVGMSHPPVNPEEDWRFIDVVPHAFDFQMNPRAAGMIGGFVALPALLQVDRINDNINHCSSG